MINIDLFVSKTELSVSNIFYHVSKMLAK